MQSNLISKNVNINTAKYLSYTHTPISPQTRAQYAPASGSAGAKRISIEGGKPPYAHCLRNRAILPINLTLPKFVLKTLVSGIWRNENESLFYPKRSEVIK